MTAGALSLPLTEAEAAELARWRIGKRTVPEWLATDPAQDQARAVLVRSLDRPGRGGVFARVLAAHLGVDADEMYAGHYPRKASRLAAEARERGDHPHAEKLHAALVALMFCANCGRPLADPLSIERGIGPDCWEQIDPGWRGAILGRLSGQETLT